MRALVVDPTLVDPGSGRGRGRRRRAQASSSLPVEVRDVRTPVPPGPGWVLIRPALAGICGTDLALFHRDPLPNVLTAYGNVGTFIPGHEVVGVVERASSTRWAHEGDRVLVEPTLRCAHKGLALLRPVGRIEREGRRRVERGLPRPRGHARARRRHLRPARGPRRTGGH